MTEQNGKQFSIMEDEKFMEFMTDKFGGIDERLDVMGEDISNLKEDVNYLKTNMVTKSFLTDKLIDLKNDLNEKIKKEDTKVGLLADVLVDKKVLKEEDVKEVKGIEVFSV